MTKTWRTRHRRSAWAIGVLVLLGLGLSIYSLLETESGRMVASRLRQTAAVEDAGPPSQLSSPAAKPGAKVPLRGRPIRGVVKLPSGRPAAGATVTIYRALTAWPEWRREQLDRAITGADGAFEFRFETTHGLLIGFEHPGHAGGLEEVSQLREQELRLVPGFRLDGYVRSPAGPVPNARVVVESVVDDARRAEERTTGPDGRYRFTNLAAGPVRLVARHDSWQPRTMPAVVIGDLRQVDLQFERPSAAPLRGRVISAVSQLPIEGAVVDVLAGNQRPGLVQTIRTATGPDGSFFLSGLPRGKMQLLVRHEAHGADMSPLVIGATTAEVPIELPSRSEVSGRLVSVASQHEFRGGELLQIRDLAGQIGYAVVAADGRFRFAEPLSPGPASITVLDRRFSFDRSNTPEIAVKIAEAARTELELQVRAPTVVKGRVVDEAGAALANVAVILTKVVADARSISDAAFQFDFGAVGSQVVQLFGQDHDELVAVSGADGAFEIRGHKPGPLQVRFELSGRGSRRVSSTVPDSSEPKELESIILPRGCRVQGTVLRGGRRIAGALVAVIGPDCTGMTVTRGDGSFAVDDLLPGEYRLRASLPAQPKGPYELVTAAPDHPVNRVLIFSSGRTVRGTVSGSDGQPVVGAIVAVRGSLGQTTRTDDGGDFLLELPDRAVELQVSLSDRSRSDVKSVPLGVDRVEITLDAPPMCTLTAQVAGLPGKKRLAGALLRLTKLDGDEGETNTRWVELQDGELRWPLCPVGSVRVEICGDGYAPYSVDRDFVANEDHTLGEVLLEPGGRVHGIVQDQSGSPVAGAIVLLGEEGDLDLFEPRVRTGADGSFRISGVTARSRHLVVRAPGFAARTIELQLPQDVLGSTPLSVVLEQGSTIEVTLKGGARDGGIVQLRRGGRLVASTETDESGRASFSNRSAGTYSVQLFGSQMAPVEVVVGATPTVSVRLP
ncbi:MAG TPA: carboxypeptidase regulatory-like domain-containing protein [Planctomycetota bacterium]|nr:carboxypeptidase regulatory-like domain-containing protein [Planctomycetota bacterium]